ncbi:hypothetical protein SAICODRAFT_31854 [Saitoella complicata NRRL Y-17804]|uniref:uncharacterized protein n=1 Tax=Saitoella complicata (strain BCRC 22490 / CBS 7301 / JCM 7358 / NBRC 10748 / NRRL Y-17804) TaxID=698492 RepID=UPI000866FC99|nr:uncharacterized protein SAICODRAFT_31854 [Saitoella complicata NRRL Y-17804]ODQ50562.1 hypothetical protein SAICODRAFT_31854 [Saitoella complicata NRRL Y-17804]
MPDPNIEDIPYSELSHEERTYHRAQIVALTKAEIPKEKIEEQYLVKRRTLDDITNRWWKTASYRDSPRSGRPQILSNRDKDELTRSVRTGKYNNNAVEAAAAFNYGHQRDVSTETRSVLHRRGNRFCRLRLGKGVTNGQRSTCTGGRRTGCGSSTPTNRNTGVLGQDMLQNRENEFIPRMHSGEFLLLKLQEFRESHIKLTIQHDNNAKFHVPNCKESYEREGYRVLPWPAYSPDMNLIEDF